MEPSRHTRHTLLERACNPSDEQAWEEFVHHYRRFICYILTQVGVEGQDIDDLAQQILMTLTRDLASYDRSRAKFRTWLGTVIRHAAFAHLRRQKRHRIQLTSFGREYQFDDPGEAASDLDRLIENEWATYISSLAMERVREVFRGQAVEAFELGLDGHSAESIANRTGLSVSSVYTLRKRVKKRLYLEIRALTHDLEP